MKDRRNAEYERLKRCADAVAPRLSAKPEIGIVLGSGLGGFGEQAEIREIVNYAEIEGFPVSTVKGHSGRYLFGTLRGREVVMMQGRVHYYEGYDMNSVVLPVRLMGMLGAEKVILTNAAGGINPDFHPGTLMLITDHISMFVPSPLRGANIDELGTRFPDMSAVYGEDLRETVRNTAAELGIEIREGVYVQHPGPNFETPAEIRAYRSLGADAVGMSTACEAMALRHMGIGVCGISCITNMAAGMSSTPLTHEEVQKTADRVSAAFRKLLAGVVERI